MLGLPVAAALAAAQPAPPAPIPGEFVVESFRFDSGESLPGLRLHYQTLGTPHRGILEREIARVARGKYVLIPIGDETRGHGTHSRPVVWKQHLTELLDRSRPSAP